MLEITITEILISNNGWVRISPVDNGNPLDNKKQNDLISAETIDH